MFVLHLALFGQHQKQEMNEKANVRATSAYYIGTFVALLPRLTLNTYQYQADVHIFLVPSR